jgi:hypothetical protein
MTGAQAVPTAAEATLASSMAEKAAITAWRDYYLEPPAAAKTTVAGAGNRSGSAAPSLLARI